MWLWVGWTGYGDGVDGRGGDDQTAISACLCFNATLTISRDAMVDPTENSLMDYFTFCVIVYDRNKQI